MNRTIAQLISEERKRAQDTHSDFRSVQEFYGALMQRMGMIQDCLNHNYHKGEKSELAVITILQAAIILERGAKLVEFDQEKYDLIIEATKTPQTEPS